MALASFVLTINIEKGGKGQMTASKIRETDKQKTDCHNLPEQKPPWQTSMRVGKLEFSLANC